MREMAACATVSPNTGLNLRVLAEEQTHKIIVS